MSAEVYFILVKHISVVERQECGLLFVHDLDRGKNCSRTSMIDSRQDSEMLILLSGKTLL